MPKASDIVFFAVVLALLGATAAAIVHGTNSNGSTDPSVEYAIETGEYFSDKSGKQSAPKNVPPGLGDHPETATTAATSSCKTAYVTRSWKNQLGTTIFTFTQTKTWCWSGGNVTSWNAKVSGRSISGGWRYLGLSSSTSNYYAWQSGRPKSGHVTYRQGKFTNKALSSYVGITIYSHSDGSWNYATT